jgi:hypothetical protein
VKALRCSSQNRELCDFLQRICTVRVAVQTCAVRVAVQACAVRVDVLTCTVRVAVQTCAVRVAVQTCAVRVDVQTSAHSPHISQCARCMCTQLLLPCTLTCTAVIYTRLCGTLRHMHVTDSCSRFKWWDVETTLTADIVCVRFCLLLQPLAWLWRLWHYDPLKHQKPVVQLHSVITS